MISYPDSFCAAPFVNLNLDVDGKIKPCCMFAHHKIQSDHKMPDIINSTIEDVYNGPEMSKLRQAFLNGDKPQECERCWKEEAVGNKSFRQTQYPKTVELKDQYYPTMFDLKLSNVCNLKCRMCSSKASSLISKERGGDRNQELYLSNKIIGTPNEKMFLNQLANITFIELTGGEPFVSPENKKLIQLIANTEHASKITIRLTTNGMTVNDAVIEHLKKFKAAYITFSIDDLHDRLYYSRSGAIHDQIVSNLNKVREADVHTQVYCTINNYNIWFLQELDDYYGEINYGHLSYPQELCIQSLPYEVKKRIVNRLTNPKWKNTINFMMYEHINTGNNFLVYNHKLDNIRNTNFRQTFGEWADLIYEFM